MNYIRGRTAKGTNENDDGIVDPNMVAGLMSKKEFEDLMTQYAHPALHVADLIRFHLGELFSSPTPNSAELNDNGNCNYNNIYDCLRRQQLLISTEEQLNTMILEMGAMERIKGTPLPLVYVAHLRTWLILFLLAMPYFLQEALGYLTIPVVLLIGFAMLGLDGAAEEMESPFRKDRTNHLDMNSFCLTVVSNVFQQIKDDADRRRTVIGGSNNTMHAE